MSRLSRLWVSALLVSACAMAADVEGRYIVYLAPETASTLRSPEDQAALLARWGQTLDGTLRLERALATGGWVITVTSPGDANRQMQAIGQLPGVDSVERDAVLRHQ